MGEDAALQLQAAGMLAGQFNNVAANIENEDLLKDNYEWNEKMFEKQMKYNWDMWNKTNEYNSPSQMVDRLLAAGINPALALEKQGAAVAANQGGSVSAGSPGSISVTPYDPSPSLAKASDIIMQVEARDLALERAYLENQDLRNEVYSNRETRALQNDILRQEYGLRSYDYSYQRDTYDSRVGLSYEELRGKVGANLYLDAQVAVANVERQLKVFELEHAPEEFKATIGLLSAQTFAAYKQGEAAGAAAFASATQALVNQATEYGIKLSNKKAEEILSSEVNVIRSRNNLERKKNNREAEYYDDTKGQTFRKLRQIKNRNSVLMPSGIGPQSPTSVLNLLPRIGI